MPLLRTIAISLSIAGLFLLLPEMAMACGEVDPCKTTEHSYGKWFLAGGLLLAYGAFVIFCATRNPWPTLSLIDPNDPRIAGAKLKARASIHEFWASHSNPAEDEERFLLKIALPTEDGNEFIWIGEISDRNGQLFGRLENEPISYRYQFGQLIRFDHDQIVDWTYEKAGVPRGNFSLAVMLFELSERKRHRLLKRIGWTSDDLLARTN
jgi:uncharacterized protein YegJ (DUF2314 family)